MNRKAPLVPIFNCKKRSREAIIAEPQDQFDASSYDVNRFEYSSNNAGYPIGNTYDHQMYDSSGSLPSVNPQWNSGQLQKESRINNNSRYQFQNKLPDQHGTMPRRTVSGQNVSSSFPNQMRSNQRSLENMELIPPNPPNPKSARYSVNQRSVGTGGQGQLARPSGSGNQGWGSRGSVSTARQSQTTSNTCNQRYGRSSGGFNKTSDAGALGRGHSGGGNQYSYNQVPASTIQRNPQWNSGNGYGNQGRGSMNTIGSGGAPDCWNQWETDREKSPYADISGQAPVIDRRYAPIASSFQMPNAAGEGWGPTNIKNDHVSKTEWHTQAQINQAFPQKTEIPTKPEKQPIQKPALDRSLRVISTDLEGIKNWEHLKGTLTFLFEIYAQVNSATVKVPDTDAKRFNIKEGSNSMDCIFYEIDHSLSKLTRGKLYRIVGSFDSQQNLIKCVSIREALQNEYVAHQKNVQMCGEYKLKLSNIVREQ